MYLLTSPDLSLRSEVLFKRLSAFFDVDPGLQGQMVLLWESDQLLKNLMDIHAVESHAKISSIDGVFIYRTLSSENQSMGSAISPFNFLPDRVGDFFNCSRGGQVSA